MAEIGEDGIEEVCGNYLSIIKYQPIMKWRDQKILIQVKSENELIKIQTHWLENRFVCNLTSTGKDKSEAILSIKRGIYITLKSSCTAYINSWSGTEKKRNCGFGFISPIDSWHCKVVKKPCPIQSCIDLEDRDCFFSNCLLGKKEQENIWNTIKTNKYDGLHHNSGRIPCRTCTNKEKRGEEPKWRPPKLYFPWELTYLKEHIDIYSIWDDFNRAEYLIRNNFPEVAKFTPLCPDCFIKILKFFPEMDVKEFEVLRFDMRYTKNEHIYTLQLNWK